jgi:transcriptional regulator with XRE-family HTH domain
MRKKTVGPLPTEDGGLPAFDEAYHLQYPHAQVAFAIAELRGRLGLTQAELGKRIGSPQSVIARLESGKHGIGVVLLNRIAKALGTEWRPTFALLDDDDASPVKLSNTTDSGDLLLDAFNSANTRGDHDRAHRYAVRISKDAGTPRRQLALALDAFNRGRHRLSLKWANMALAGVLPVESASVARVVAARSQLALGRADRALQTLADAGDSQSAHAARAEALMEMRQVDAAVEVVEHMLTGPEELRGAGTEFLAARAYLLASRPEDALLHIGAFLAQKPDDVAGQLVHGAILGSWGDLTGEQRHYERAIRLFEPAIVVDDATAIRLYAMTAARLGRWRDALPQARRLLDLADPVAADAARFITADSLERLEDPGDIEGAARLAGELTLAEPLAVRSQIAFACALRGDFEESVSALDLTTDRLDEASPEDQIRCSSAFLVKGDLAAAFPILWRNEQALSNPDGQLFLARSALAAKNTTVAGDALRRVAEGDATSAETAQVALDLVAAIQNKGAFNVLDDVPWVTTEPIVSRSLIEVKRWATSRSIENWRFEYGQTRDSAFDVLDLITGAEAATAVLAN